MTRSNYFADLHNHTTASDGALTPTELVAYAEDLGIHVLGITDHDTITGLHEALVASETYNVDILTGVEITVRFSEPFFKGSLHLLAYFDTGLLENPRFNRETDTALSMGRGESLTRIRIEAINEWFAPEGHTPLLLRHLTEKDVYAHGDRISRRHFALALDSMGVKDRQIINEIIGNDSPAYVPSGSPISDLRSYLGNWPFALILAHPAAGSYPGENLYREVLPPFETVDKLMPVFMEAGISGLEIEYPGHTQEWKERLRYYANQLNLPLVTGGSDCHDRDTRPLGLAGVGVEEVESIRRFLRF